MWAFFSVHLNDDVCCDVWTRGDDVIFYAYYGGGDDHDDVDHICHIGLHNDHDDDALADNNG